MRCSICKGTLLGMALLMATSSAWGQKPEVKRAHAFRSIDLAVTYDAARSNTVPGSNFWMQGGSAQLHLPLPHGLGAVADVAGLHTGSMYSGGAGLDLVTVTFGPRYTWNPAHHTYSLYAQVLEGVGHGMNSVFPDYGGSHSSRSSLALQAGGGVNVSISPRLSVRAIEAGWLRTELPNATNDAQNTLRLGAGLIYCF
jgi:hypothetical protein